MKEPYPDLLVRAIRNSLASEGKAINKIKRLMDIVALVILVLPTLCVNTTMTTMMPVQSRPWLRHIRILSSITCAIACFGLTL